MNSPRIDEFITAAIEFRSLAERQEPLKESELWEIRGILLRLVFHIPAVDGASHSTAFDSVRADDVTYQKVVRRFSDFPFNFYRVVFDPHDFEATDEPVMGLLSDDLSDIYRDLIEGLSNYENGHLEEACFDWSFGYRSHWARHAVNAIAAIEIYRTDNYKNVESGRDGRIAPATPPTPPGMRLRTGRFQ